MKEKLEKLIEDLKKMQEDDLEESKKNSTFRNEKYFYKGSAAAFSVSVQLISDILNSENPNSVSNQPTEE